MQITPRIHWFPPSEEGRVDLAVIIVSWNVREHLLANLEALAKSEGRINAECIVIDNASADRTVEAVRSTFPWVQVIANKDNRGFTKANNQGLAIRRSRHVLLLNPDMRVEPDALQKTVEYLDVHQDVGVVGAKLIGQDGKAMHHMRRFPTVFDQSLVALKLKIFFPCVMFRYLAKDLSLDQEQQVDSVRGSYFAISENALQRIGGLDERYFIWFEEVDYCKQVQQKQMKVTYVPSIVAHDLVGQSFNKQDTRWKQAQFRNSMVTYFRKWHPGPRVWMIRLAWLIVWPYVWLKTL